MSHIARSAQRLIRSPVQGECTCWLRHHVPAKRSLQKSFCRGERQEERSRLANQRHETEAFVKRGRQVVDGVCEYRVGTDRSHDHRSDRVENKQLAYILAPERNVAGKPPDENGRNGRIARQLAGHILRDFGERYAARRQRVEASDSARRDFSRDEALGVVAPDVLGNGLPEIVVYPARTTAEAAA